jgi:sugar phosphate isomerase/epimerase
MFIETMTQFEAMERQVRHPAFGLTLDLGHLVCLKETPISDHLVRWQSHLWNLHLDDMRPGVHDHLPFGQGEVDFAGVDETLARLAWQGPATVELSRHSHDAVRTAAASREYLRRFPYLSGT